MSCIQGDITNIFHNCSWHKNCYFLYQFFIQITSWKTLAKRIMVHIKLCHSSCARHKSHIPGRLSIVEKLILTNEEITCFIKSSAYCYFPFFCGIFIDSKKIIVYISMFGMTLWNVLFVLRILELNSQCNWSVSRKGPYFGNLRNDTI